MGGLGRSRGSRRARWVRRALRIGAQLAFQTAWYLVGAALLRLTARGRTARQAFFGRRVLGLFRSLGATFIKVGQVMSTRPDLLPEYVTDALARLQDDVGPFPFAIVERTLREDLQREPHELFREIAPVPIASASVAQVHKARLHDGRVIALKVRRPDLRETCAFDLHVMRTVARALERLPWTRAWSPLAAVEEFGRAVEQQLDFRIEAENNQRFRDNFAATPGISFPELVPELGSERLLAMTFVEGRKILPNAAPKEVAARLARLGLRALLEMIFVHGFVHADLHPGNVLVTPGGGLVLLDLGLVATLSPEHRHGFSNFFRAWAQRDGDAMARLIYRMSSRAEVADWDEAQFAAADDYQRFRAAMIGFVGRYWGQRLGDIQVGRVLLDLLTILRRHRVRMNPSFTVVNIAIAVTEGIGKQLDPSLDLISEALPFLAAHSATAA